MNEIALKRRLYDYVAEYNEKLEKAEQEIATFEAAGSALKMAATIGGTYGRERMETGSVHARVFKRNLLKSAWWHIYEQWELKKVFSAKDKNQFERSMESPPEFTLDNIRATFGDYIMDPRGNILRGLAEVFCDLDPAYKSHDKVKIGVNGLPKRVIISGVNSIYGWGKDCLQNILNALAQYQGKPLVSYDELNALMKNENALKDSRGVRLRRFANGNGHLFFEPDALRDINLALAEYYGDVLPDCSEDKPTQKRESTSVSKDLQYYPTPMDVVHRVLDGVYNIKGKKVLEPSCGCGRFMDELRIRGAEVFGIEFDAGRAEECRKKGHAVFRANFLEVAPKPEFDFVVMNPPFYGTHYAKHVEYALKFLKPDGILTAILPATARYDHGLLDGRWEDLPVGSFRESGTNINTTVLTIRNNPHGQS